MNNRLLVLVIGGLLLLAALLVGLAVACSPNRSADQTAQDDGDVTLTYWRLFDDKDKFEPLIADYQKTHPKIKIEYRKLTFDEYEKALNEALAAGKGPDIFSVQNSWMPKFFDKIEPIPESMFAVADYEAEFYPAVRDTIKGNRIYAIPISMDALILYVNTGLLTRSGTGEPPKTWDDLVGKAGDPNKPGLVKQLNNRQGDTFNQSAIVLGNSRVSRAPDILALMMLQQRTNMVNEDQSQAIFNLTQNVEGKEVHLGTEALRFYTSFANPATANYSWNAKQGDGTTAFAQGRAVMMLGYAYHAPIIERLNPDLSYTTTQAPQIAGTDPVNYASYWAEAVAKTSKHQKEAWEFVRYLTEGDAMAKYAEATRNVPARRKMNAGGKIEEVKVALATATTWYKGDAQKADEAFVTMINQVLGGEDPQRAIDTAANRVTQTFRDLKGSP